MTKLSTTFFSKAFTLAFVMNVLCLPMMAYDFAVENTDNITIYYNDLGNNTCAVTYATADAEDGNSYTGDVVIPAQVQYNSTNYSVTEIGDDAFYLCPGLTSVVIPEGVTQIGNSAFGACNNLTIATLPEGLTHIGANAFRECTSLQSIDFPTTLTHIGLSAFRNCSSLKEVSLPESLEFLNGFAFRDCTNLEKVTFHSDCKVTWLAATFEGCSDLKEVNIPASVTDIYANTFKDCTSLETIHLERDESNLTFPTINHNGPDESSKTFPEDVNFTVCLPNEMEDAEVPESWETARENGVKIVYPSPDATINVGSLTFTRNADEITYCLTKITKGDAIIPETIVSSNGRIYAVTAAIGNSDNGGAFINNTEVPSVTFAKTITKIGDTYNAKKWARAVFQAQHYESVSTDIFGLSAPFLSILGGLKITEIYLDVEGTELPTGLAANLKDALGKYFSQVTVYAPIGYNSTSAAAQEWTDAGFTLVEKDMRPTTLSIGSQEGWGTFYSDNYIQMPEGVTGYVVSAAEDGVLTMDALYPAGSIVPAQTALLVKGAKADYTYTNIDDETLKAAAQTPASNLLRGTYRRKAAIADTEGTESDYRFYKLAYSGGTNLGFYWGGNDGISFVNGEQKAYLMLPRTATAASAKGFSFRDAVTGIENVEAAPADKRSEEIYTIDGHRTTQPLAPGIYIQAGKKFYVK